MTDPISQVDLCNLTALPSTLNDHHTPATTNEMTQTPIICECHGRIKTLERRIKHLTSQVKKLQFRRTAPPCPAPKASNDAPMQTAMKEFIAVAQAHDIQIKPNVIIDTFLQRAETAEDARLVLQKAKTLERVKSRISKQRDQQRLGFYLRRRYSVNRIFRRKEDLEKYTNSLAVVFDNNILKKVSDTMLFYHLPLHPDLRHFRVLRAHFDGKYTSCPRPYKQSVELRLVLGWKDQEITVTFARALLSGCKTRDYVEFFTQVRNSKAKKIPLIVTDYEIAVSVAIRQVFPRIQIRGCWYHYWNNALSTSGLLGRVTQQQTSKVVINFLSVLPFLRHPQIFVMELIKHLGHADEFQRYKDVNFKLIMYVYGTYMKRFAHMSSIDLQLSLERTNNTCEGSNSGLSKYSAKKLTLREFATYTENQFKVQHLAKPKTSRRRSQLDNVLIAIQDCSKRSISGLFRVLVEFMQVDKFALKKVPIDSILGVPRDYEEKDILPDNSTHLLNDMLVSYRRMRTYRRRMFTKLKESLSNMMDERLFMAARGEMCETLELKSGVFSEEKGSDEDLGHNMQMLVDDVLDTEELFDFHLGEDLLGDLRIKNAITGYITGNDEAHNERLKIIQDENDDIDEVNPVFTLA